MPAVFGNQGFSVYVLGAPATGNYPQTKADALAAIALESGIPTPGGVIDRSITIGSTGAAQQIMAANVARVWVAIFNPVAPQVGISKTTAVWGSSTNVMVGPAESMFWATAQGNGAAYTGALTAVGLTPDMPLWAWEA